MQHFSWFHAFKVKYPYHALIQFCSLKNAKSRPCGFPLKICDLVSTKRDCKARDVFFGTIENREIKGGNLIFRPLLPRLVLLFLLLLPFLLCNLCTKPLAVRVPQKIC